MKTLVKTISMVVLTFGLANCGGGGGGNSTPAPVEPDTNQVTQGANQIDFDAKSILISWSQGRNNIYISDTSSCYYGYPTNADDNVAASKISELSNLINTSTIGVGTLASPGSDSVYLTVRYANETRTFNLRTASASTDEETLSRGAEIIAFFNQAQNDIASYDYRTCDSGNKGDKGYKY